MRAVPTKHADPLVLRGLHESTPTADNYEARASESEVPRESVLYPLLTHQERHTDRDRHRHRDKHRDRGREICTK